MGSLTDSNKPSRYFPSFSFSFSFPLSLFSFLSLIPPPPQVLSVVYSSSIREGDEDNILFSLGWLGKIHQFHGLCTIVRVCTCFCVHLDRSLMVIYFTDNHESAKGYFSKQLKVTQLFPFTPFPAFPPTPPSFLTSFPLLFLRWLWI